MQNSTVTHRASRPIPIKTEAPARPDDTDLDSTQAAPKRWTVLTPKGRRRTFIADIGEIDEAGALILWRNSSDAWEPPALVIALAPSAWVEVHCADDDDAAASASARS